MTLYLVLVLVVFSSLTKANSYNEYSTFVTDEDFEHQFFQDGIEDAQFTSEPQDSPDGREDADLTKGDVAPMPYPYYEERQGESDIPIENGDGRHIESGVTHSVGPQILNLNRVDEIPSEKHLLDHFSKLHNKVYNIYEDSFHKKDGELNQPPIRREIIAWRDELTEPDNAPWSLDSFYSRQGAPSGQGDYLDEPGYAVDPLEDKNNSSAREALGFKDILTVDDQSPYYHKNYHYTYYPLTNTRQMGKMPKTNYPDDREGDRNVHSRENNNGRKVMRKSACKQYLQFLKYAFERLEENGEYNYDYNEDYIEEWRDRAPQRNHKVFAVHLLGPTLYVDNSGRVSQISAKGYHGNDHHGSDHHGSDSIPLVQNIPTVTKEEIKPPSSSTPPPIGFSTRMRAEPLTTVPNDNVHESQKTSTTEQPWLKISLKTNLTDPIPTKEQRLNPEVQYRSSYGSRLEEQWRQQIGDDVYDVTTVKAKTEHTMFDEYDYGDTKPSYTSVHTYPPKWTPSEDYYRMLAKNLERQENDTKSNIISSETSAAVAPFYWRSPSPTPQATTLFPIYTKSVRYEPTEISTDMAIRRGGGEGEEDCNDKMLPCPDTVNVTYPLNGYCNRYVSCESGRAIRKTCPEGLHFNLVTRSCDLPHNSFCMYTCPAANGYYGIPGDCGGYFVCKNYVPDYRMCPPRMHWDIKRTTCTFAELSSCPMKCTKPSEVKAYDGDCKAYVICLNGIPYYHKCPPNMKFDKQAQTCIRGHESKCEDDQRLLTKTTNPNYLCKDVEMKLGTKVWCNYFFEEENQNQNYKKPFDE